MSEKSRAGRSGRLAVEAPAVFPPQVGPPPELPAIGEGPTRDEELATLDGRLEEKVRELEVANDDLDNLLTSTTIATVFLDRGLRIKRFTPAASDLFGLDPSDAGRPVGEVERKFARQDLPVDAEAVLASAAPIRREIHTHDGRWYLRRVLPYRTRGGLIEGVVVTFSEVTELKQMEKAARYARDYAESIVETLRSPLLMLEADFRVRSANRSFYEMFRVARGDVSGRVVFDLCDGQWDVPGMHRVLEGASLRDGTSKDVEVDRHFAGIGRKTILLNARPISLGGEGPRMILLAMDDITVRREQAEKKLRDSEERLRIIVETSPVGIANVEAESGKVIHANPAFRAMLGYDEDDLSSTEFMKILHPSDARRHAEDLERSGGDSRREFLELRCHRKDGSIMWGRLAATAVRSSEGRTMYNIYMLENITERKELERQIADLPISEQRRIGQELHDNTGQELTGLAYMTRSMIHRFTEKSLPELALATRISEGIERALYHLRLIAKGLIPVEVDSNGLMAALGELAARTGELFGVSCTFECGRPVPFEDNNTATHLYRIAQEAVTNALKHGRARQVRISLGAGEGLVRLDVQDDGLGLRDPIDKGTGMGLRIMRYRAGLIGATLDIGPAPAGGTLLTCSLGEGDHHG